MLPPPPGTLPRKASLTAARHLAVGDLIFLDTASSPIFLRSLILRVRGRHYLISNKLHPEPYEVFLPLHKQVWAVKNRPSPEVLHHTQREPDRDGRGTREYAKPEDPRKYWKWDPADPRAKQEYHSVEENEWKRLNSWWRKKQKARPRPKRRVIDSQVASWYKLLGVRAGITTKELKSAYKKAAFTYHPDRCKDPTAEEMFKKISDAYTNLSLLFAKKG